MTNKIAPPDATAVVHVTRFEKAGHAADGSRLILALEIEGKLHHLTLCPDKAVEIAEALRTQTGLATVARGGGKATEPSQRRFEATQIELVPSFTKTKARMIFSNVEGARQIIDISSNVALKLGKRLIHHFAEHASNKESPASSKKH